VTFLILPIIVCGVFIFYKKGKKKKYIAPGDQKEDLSKPLVSSWAISGKVVTEDGRTEVLSSRTGAQKVISGKKRKFTAGDRRPSFTAPSEGTVRKSADRDDLEKGRKIADRDERLKGRKSADRDDLDKGDVLVQGRKSADRDERRKGRKSADRDDLDGLDKGRKIADRDERLKGRISADGDDLDKGDVLVQGRKSADRLKVRKSALRDERLKGRKSAHRDERLKGRKSAHRDERLKGRKSADRDGGKSDSADDSGKGRKSADRDDLDKGRKSVERDDLRKSADRDESKSADTDKRLKSTNSDERLKLADRDETLILDGGRKSVDRDNLDTRRKSADMLKERKSADRDDKLKRRKSEDRKLVDINQSLNKRKSADIDKWLKQRLLSESEERLILDEGRKSEVMDERLTQSGLHRSHYHSGEVLEKDPSDVRIDISQSVSEASALGFSEKTVAKILALASAGSTDPNLPCRIEHEPEAAVAREKSFMSASDKSISTKDNSPSAVCVLHKLFLALNEDEDHTALTPQDTKSVEMEETSETFAASESVLEGNSGKTDSGSESNMTEQELNKTEGEDDEMRKEQAWES
jgi:hypothetical protein